MSETQKVKAKTEGSYVWAPIRKDNGEIVATKITCWEEDTTAIPVDLEWRKFTLREVGEETSLRDLILHAYRTAVRQKECSRITETLEGLCQYLTIPLHEEKPEWEKSWEEYIQNNKGDESLKGNFRIAFEAGQAHERHHGITKKEEL